MVARGHSVTPSNINQPSRGLDIYLVIQGVVKFQDSKVIPSELEFWNQVLEFWNRTRSPPEHGSTFWNRFQFFGTKFQKFHVAFTKLESRKYLIYKAFMSFWPWKFQNSSFFQQAAAKRSFSVQALWTRNATYHQAKLYPTHKTAYFLSTHHQSLGSQKTLEFWNFGIV